MGKKGKHDSLVDASSDAELHAEQTPVKKCKVKPNVSPILTVANPKIVVVKKTYQTKPHRLRVRLGTDVKFTGTGRLDSPTAGDIKVFDSKGAEQPLPWDISGSKLSKGVTVQVEGVRASAGVNATSVTLALNGGDKTVVNSPATDTLTCVQVDLNLGQYKPAPGGGDPGTVPDRIGVGRNLHVQTPGWWAGRALLFVGQAQPAGYAGDVVLKSQGGKVRAFGYALEIAASGQTIQADPLTTSNAALVGGLKLWIEGVSESTKVRDTGFTVEISDLPGVEVDRANVTVVKPTLAMYELPKKPGAKPVRMSETDKMDPGRRVHLQDVGNHHGRARVVVKRVKPKTWTGTLELNVVDPLTTAASANLNLFTTDKPGAVAHGNPINHSPAYPKDGTMVWAEGAATSTALRDAELRLRVTDAEGDGDRGRFTIHELYVTAIRFNGIVDIYYARIPTAGSYILPPAAEPPAHHHSPVAVRPAAATPHWKKVVAAQNPAAEVSWPAVFARRKASGVAAPTLDASFELFPKVAGSVTVPIKADGGASGLTIDEQDVTFTNGDAIAVSFDIKGLPNLVKRLDGIELDWHFDGPAHKTKHTLFVTDKMPRAANNLFADEYLWEIFEWACGWADGHKGTSAVTAAIWTRFKPAAAAHATGLEYWKNWAAGVAPAHDLVTAIQSQDPPTPANQQNAASCIVFDRVFMNCIAAHGIPSAEIKIVPDGTVFIMGGGNWTCTRWVDTTVDGQGHLGGSPPRWASHWIADAKVSGWAFYDASYGDGPTKAPEPPLAGNTMNIMKFEPRTAAQYEVMNTATGAYLDIPWSPDPAVPPHLIGTILWTNK